MRSFEVPAMGGCMLAEDTDDHREIFGEEGNAVCYFKNTTELLVKLRWLVEHERDRHRLAIASHELILGRPNTYCDRLVSMLQHAN
jgi:spore maturation protein CgeB